jgi:hypothetical protein
LNTVTTPSVPVAMMALSVAAVSTWARVSSASRWSVTSTPVTTTWFTEPSLVARHTSEWRRPSANAQWFS